MIVGNLEMYFDCMAEDDVFSLVALGRISWFRVHYGMIYPTKTFLHLGHSYFFEPLFEFRQTWSPVWVEFPMSPFQVPAYPCKPSSAMP